MGIVRAWVRSGYLGVIGLLVWRPVVRIHQLDGLT